MRQFSYPNSQFTNILGGASIGWKLNVYDTGTTDYASIYSNLAQTTPTANPVIADADGFLASFYWTGTVDVVLTDENDNLIDSATGIQDLVSTINAVVVAGNISLPYGAASGSGDTITATLPITADFSDGGVFIVRANAANSGASNTPNLQINSYASRRIKKIGGIALVANDIVSGMNCLMVYNLAQGCYYLLNPNASYLNRDGTAKMLGAIDMDSHKITNLANGTDSGDAVNKSQLDAKAPFWGNAAQEFAVAAATVGSNAVNKTQLDAKTGLATDTVAGIVEKATQAETNSGAADKYPDAALIKAATWTPKAFVVFTADASTATIDSSYNVATVVRNSTGQYTVTFSNTLPSTPCVSVDVIDTSTTGGFGGSTVVYKIARCKTASTTVITLTVRSISADGNGVATVNYVDVNTVSVVAF